jgi:hypothetical protein
MTISHQGGTLTDTVLGMLLAVAQQPQESLLGLCGSDLETSQLKTIPRRGIAGALQPTGFSLRKLDRLSNPNTLTLIVGATCLR